MKQIKLCSGFDKSICKYCKRKSNIGTKLVDKLSVEESTGFSKCEFYLR